MLQICILCGTILQASLRTIEIKVFKPGPDRTIRLGNPRTIHFYGPFKVKNRLMQKKHGPVRTTVQPYDSMNHDQFTRFKWLPCFKP